MMETAVVSVSMGVMKPLLSKLTKLLGEEYAKLKGVRKQIRFLRDELGAMAPTLEMLADAEQLDPQTKQWRDKLRELAYDLEDCIDDFMRRVDHERDGNSGFFERFFNKLKKLKPRHEIANQIEELKARVVETSKRHKRYAAQLRNNSSASSVDPRLQALYEDIDRLVGIDGPKKHVIELLNLKMDVSSAKVKIISIAGCGGLGKTTLAKQVYDTVKSQFSCAAFVSVSRTPNVRKILIHIADGVKVKGINTHDDDEQQLIDKLKEHLHDKRYIVVIDDVWDKEAWEIIKLALPNNDRGSKIITTTRSVTVARCCSSQVYEMEPLSFDDSKRLFFKRAFGYEDSCYSHLEDVPEKILRKCHGLPLAIVTVSSMLTNKFAKVEWERVLSAIGSALANNPDAKKMASIISLSYFDIPHNLRACLLYLSVFPEDYRIEKHCLINRWIAEGYIHDKESRTKYECGEDYFNDLINRSMIQPVDVEYGQAKACRVHDIILDFIKCKAAEENFVTSLDDTEHVDPSSSEYKVRRLCVSNNTKENVTVWKDQTLSHVRSITIFGEPVKASLLPYIALRVLDLGGCWSMDDHHLASIEKLFHLRYLRLSGLITKLPEEVGGLQHLQTLDVRGTRIKELPPSITKLQQLACLYVDGYVRFPDAMIGKMLSLEELRKYGVISYEQGKSIPEFRKLTRLRTLNIKWKYDLPDGLEGRSQAEGIYSCVGNLLSSCNLHSLYLKCFPREYPLLLDSWNPAASCSIRELRIDGFIYKVPNWMGSLRNLGVLEIEVICVRLEDVMILGEMPSLLFLQLSTVGGTNGRIIIHNNNMFRSLRYFYLQIGLCGTSLEFEEGSMPKLEHVKLDFNAHEMECLNGASCFGIQRLSALTKVEVIIRGNHVSDEDCDPAKDDHDGAVRCVSRAISAAIETLPNRPTVTFRIPTDDDCIHFETGLRMWNEKPEGLSTEWLKIWQIREEQPKQPTDKETKQELSMAKDETYRGEEQEPAYGCTEEKTDEKELAQQEHNGDND